MVQIAGFYGFADGIGRGGGTLIGASAGADLGADVMAAFHRAVASIDAVAPAIAAAARQAAERYEAGGRLIYVGAGASGLIAAQDASELPGTFGLDPRRVVVRIAGGTDRPFAIDAAAEDDEAEGVKEMLALGDLGQDVVLAVSASGTTPYTLGAARAAREARAFLVALGCRPRSLLLDLGSAPLALDVGDEALKGSTRLAAGTAQKCALGLFSTLLGEALGHIHERRMINLKAENEKLRRRALGIVADISAAGEEAASRALALSEGDVKRAILIARGAADGAEAARYLEFSRGRMGEALRALESSAGRQGFNRL